MVELVKLIGYITVKDVENELISIRKDVNNDLVFDLRDCTYIRVEALVYMMVIVTGRSLHPGTLKLKTFFNYPENFEVQKFIRAFHFFETISLHINLEISEFVYNYPPNLVKEDLAIADKQELSERKLKEYQDLGFYPLTSLKFQTPEDKKNTLKEEPRKWTEGQPHISVIQKNIPNNILIGDEISRNIIYESITNSIRHPKSKLLTVNCFKEKQYSLEFILTIWDNGFSILETLKNEIKLGHSVKDPKCLDNDPHFCFCIDKQSNKPGRKTVNSFDFIFSYEIPNIHSNDEMILLSAFFPGVTRDPLGEDYKDNILREENGNQKANQLGRGLSYLLNTAVNILGAEVRVRTGKFFLNIKKAKKDYKEIYNIFSQEYPNYYVKEFQGEPDVNILKRENKKVLQALYKVKIEKIESIDDFYGNMITIQIPQTK